MKPTVQVEGPDMRSPQVPEVPDEQDCLVIRINANGLSIFIRRWRPVLGWLGGVAAAASTALLAIKAFHGLPIG